MKANARQLYEEKTLFLGKSCARLNLTPNQLTLSGAVAALISGFMLWQHFFITALVFLLASGFFAKCGLFDHKDFKSLDADLVVIADLPELLSIF